MAFKVTTKEIQQCYDFAEEAWRTNNQSQKHFGGDGRKKNEFIADQVEGKMAEFILVKFLASHGLNAKVDLNHYQGIHNTDQGDIITSTKIFEAADIDVKGSSHYAQWLLVESYKFYEIGTQQHKSKAFVMVCFGETFPGNKTLRQNPKLVLGKEFEGDAKGWAYPSDFYLPGTKIHWFEYEQGNHPWHKDVLPRTAPRTRTGLDHYVAKSRASRERLGKKITISTPLDAQINYGLPIKWLRQDWNEFIKML